MRRFSGPLLAAMALLPARLPAAEPPSSQWRPALYLLGTAERGGGPAYAPPLDRLTQDDAASAAFGLDVRQAVPGGRIEASAFALAHDPLSRADRGFYFAARARATFSWANGDWVLRLEDSPRVNRREGVSLSDFERNELWLEIDRRTSGPTLGLRISDRRRSVPNDRLQEFARQWYSAALSGGSGGRAWRLEAGPQHYTTDVTRGWRFAAAFEAAAAVLRTQTAVRFTWIEPSGQGSASRATSPTAPAGEPSPGPTQPPILRPPVLDTVAPTASAQFSPPPPQLVGPALVVDPLDTDEADWDLGRRKQELLLLGARRLPGELSATVELRAQRERGPDLTTLGPAVAVRRDRLAVRVFVRRELGRRLALLAEGSWQRVWDDRAGFPYSRRIICGGLELRP